MSIVYHVKQIKYFDAYPQYAVDTTQISNRLRGTEYISFHDRKNFANIRVRIPAGTEITGVVLGKVPNSDPTRATAPTPEPDVHDKPADLRDVGDWYDNFKFLIQEMTNSWSTSQEQPTSATCKA